MIKIGLMGFEFESPNKGCEALAFAIVQFIDKHFDNATIFVFNSNIEKIANLYPNINFVYVQTRLRDLKFKWIKAIKKCDCILDITMGDSFSDIYSVEYCSIITRNKRITEIFNKNYILMPQTYGPFNDKKNRKKAIAVINKARIVISRDKMSIDYLRELGVRREIKEHLDLAFILPYDVEKYCIDKKMKNLGINVSGLLWKGGFRGNTNQFNLTINYRQFIIQILKKYEKSDWVVHLIPHVVDLNDGAYDDDYKVLMELHNEFPNTILAPAFDNPVDAKSYISKMDCFVGSRMHSTIAAFSSGVAVIPVTYSRKFEGLFSTLDYEYLIHGNSDSMDSALSKIDKFIDNYQLLEKRISYMSDDVQKRISFLEKDLEDIIKRSKK